MIELGKCLDSIRRHRGPRRRSVALACEALEVRLALSATADLEIRLLPELDTFGDQVETIQIFSDGGQEATTFAIYDTGASVVTYSAADAELFDLLGTPLPIKVPGGASAEAIGGPLTGDVSQPVTIKADGLGAVRLTDDGNGLFQFEIDDSRAAIAPAIQTFVGTSQSASLPTITGTPIHNSGRAARIDMQGYTLDLGELFPELPEFANLEIRLPDLSFVAPGTPLDAGGPTISAPLRVPVELFGEDNSANPGDSISAVFNPVVPGIGLAHDVNGTPLHVGDQTFLFDTGAQLSVISTDIALALGLDLDNPETTLTVQGAAGSVDVAGYVIDALEIPRDDNGDGATDGTLRFLDVPIFVLDIADGIDGILGMNLWNTAYQFQYDPSDARGPSLSFTFDTDPFREVPLPEDGDLSPEGQLAIDLLAAAFPPFAGVIAGPSFPAVDLPGSLAPTLRVTGSQVRPGGLSVTLSGNLDPAVLNLYDGQDAPLDLADVSLVGEQVGPVAGSLVWDANARRLEFVKTGGPLEPDNYQFTMFSRTGGLIASDGRLLDGNGNGAPGGNYTTQFRVAPPSAPVASLPDFARGGGQAVNLAGSGGIPLRLNDAANATSFSATLVYDPALLEIGGARLAAGMPTGWQVSTRVLAPGRLSIVASGGVPLAGEREIVVLEASIPATARLGATQILRLESISLDGGRVIPIGDDALQLVAYPGDGNRSGTYSGLDASLVARVAVGLDSGFDEFGPIDPRIVADVTGNGRLTGLDASYIARAAIGLPEPSIPNLPLSSPAPLSAAVAIDAVLPPPSAESLVDPILRRQMLRENAGRISLPARAWQAAPPLLAPVKPSIAETATEETPARDGIFADLGDDDGDDHN